MHPSILIHWQVTEVILAPSSSGNALGYMKITTSKPNGGSSIFETYNSEPGDKVSIPVGSGIICGYQANFLSNGQSNVNYKFSRINT